MELSIPLTTIHEWGAYDESRRAIPAKFGEPLEVGNTEPSPKWEGVEPGRQAP